VSQKISRNKNVLRSVVKVRIKLGLYVNAAVIKTYIRREFDYLYIDVRMFTLIPALFNLTSHAQPHLHYSRQ
jgi:hypothetical protein